MRTGRKFCSKNARASPGFCGLRPTAFWQTLYSAPIHRLARRESARRAGSPCSFAGRRRTPRRDRPRPSLRSRPRSTGSYCASGIFSGLRACGRRGAAPGRAARSAAPPIRPVLRCSASVPTSLPGFGGDQFPVGIARADVAREGPDVGDVGHLVGIAVDHRAVACRASPRRAATGSAPSPARSCRAARRR